MIRCPQCGSYQVETTCRGFLNGARDDNKAWCQDCNWVGRAWQCEKGTEMSNKLRQMKRDIIGGHLLQTAEQKEASQLAAAHQFILKHYADILLATFNMGCSTNPQEPMNGKNLQAFEFGMGVWAHMEQVGVLPPPLMTMRRKFLEAVETANKELEASRVLVNGTDVGSLQGSLQVVQERFDG